MGQGYGTGVAFGKSIWRDHILDKKNLRNFGSNSDENEQRIATHLTWSIWKSRNNTVFRDCGFNCNEALFRARNIDKE